MDADWFRGNIDGDTGVFTGNVQASTVLANVSGDTAEFTGNVQSNWFQGNIDGGEAVFSGNVTAATFIGNVQGNISGNVTAAGANTQVQYNDNGVTAGSPAFVFDKSANSVTVSGNISGGNVSTAGAISATGNVSGGNINTAGQVTATGNVSGGNLVSAADVTTITVTATGNVSGGNINTSGQVTATGNVSGGNIATAGQVTATGNVSGGNIDTAGQVTATGNIGGGNIVTAGEVSAGTVVSSGNVTGDTFLGNVEGTYAVFSGNVTADYFIGNIQGNIDAGGANTQVQFNDGDVLAGSAGFTFDKTSNLVTVAGNVSAANLVTLGQVSATGNISGGNIQTSGEISALGNVSGGNVVSAADISSVTVTASGNISGGNVTSNGSIDATGNVTGGNLVSQADVTTVTVTASGNVSALYFLGDGSQLTNVYGNANVADFLANFGSNSITTTGNVTASYFIGNIQGNIDAGGANTQVQFNDNDLLAGSAGFTFDKTSNLVTVSGNVSAANVVSSGAVDAATVSASGNVSGDWFLGNISGTSGVFTANVQADTVLANVQADVGWFSGNVQALTFQGNVEAGTGSFVGNVDADWFLGNVSGNRGVFTGNVDADWFRGNVDGDRADFTGNVSANNFIAVSDISAATGSFTGNVSADWFLGNVDGTTGTFLGNVSASNVIATNSISATGNVSGNYFIGNVQGTTVALTGNVTAGNVVTSGIVDFSSGIASVATVGTTAGWYLETSFSVSAQDVEPRGVFFRSDGSRMYVCGNAGDDIIQYDLGTAWDISTATYSNAFVVSGQASTPYDVSLSADGTKMWVLDGGNDAVDQYSLSSAWDVGSATYDNITFSVASQETSPLGFWFRPDGTKMYVTGSTGDDVNEYDLSSAGNVATATFLQVSSSLAAYETGPEGLAFSSDGSKMWIVGSTWNRVTQFDLSTPWDVSTLSFNSYLPVATSGTFLVTGSSGLYVNESAGVAYITDYQNDRIFQYATDTPTGQLYGPQWTAQTDFTAGNNLSVNQNIWIGGTGRIVGGLTSQSSLTAPSFATTTSTGTTSLITGTTTGTINFATGITTGTLNQMTAQTTGIFTLGGTSATGAINIGRSVANQSIIIGNGVTGSGNVKTIDIGTLGAAGSTTNVTVGSSTAGAVNNINIYGNTTAGNIATTGQITATGNITTQGFFIGTFVGNISGNLTAPGANTQVLYNESGNAGASTAFTFDYGSNVLTVSGRTDVTGNISAGNISTSGNVSAANVSATGVVSATTVNSDDITGTDIIVTADTVTFDLAGNVDVGGTWINNLASPIQAQDAVTKQYVDDAVSSGITIHDPVRVETPSSEGSLNATYAQGGNLFTVTDTVAANTVVFSTAANLQVNDQLWFSSSFEGIAANVAYFVVSTPNTSAAVLSTAYNGAPVSNITSNTGLSQSVRVNSGQGATLTNAGANVTLTIDGVTLTTADRVLVYNQTNGAENGVYVVTVAGDAGNAWVLTRAADVNTYIPDNPNGMDAGDYFFVQEGATGAGESYVMTSPMGPFIIGYANLVFTQFSASPTYSANTQAGLELNGTVFSAKVDNISTAFDAGGNIKVRDGAVLVTPNIGAATGTSLNVTGNVTAGNVSGTLITGTLTTAAQPNITSVGTLTSLTVTGNVQGGNLVSLGSISAVGNVTGSYFLGNGSQLTGIDATSIQNGTANVRTFLNGNVTTSAAGVANVLVVTGTGANIAGTITATGNADFGNVSATTGTFTNVAGTLTTAAQPNITSVGTLSSLAVTGNITGGNVNTAGAVVVSGSEAATSTTTGSIRTAGGLGVVGNAYIGGLITATGNITGGNVSGTLLTGTVTTAAQPNITSVGNLTSLTVTGNVTGGNLVTANAISGATGVFSGNVTASYFLGNGSQLTGINASSNRIFNGNSEINIGTANGAANISIGDTSNVVVISSTGSTLLGNVQSRYATVITSNTSQVTLDSWSTSDYRSGKYYCQVTSGSSYHVIELSMVHNASNVYLTQYGEILTNTSLGNFDASISGGNVLVQFTPVNSVTTVKASATLIAV